MINWSRDERWVSPWMIEVVRIPRGVINKSLQKQAHIEQFHWDFVNTQESRIVRISWLLFVDCTTILPNVYSCSKFSCLLINSRYVIELGAIWISCRTSLRFSAVGPLTTMKASCFHAFFIEVTCDQVDVSLDMKLWKILLSFSKDIVERFGYANLYLWCSSLYIYAYFWGCWPLL